MDVSKFAGTKVRRRDKWLMDNRNAFVVWTSLALAEAQMEEKGGFRRPN